MTKLITSIKLKILANQANAAAGIGPILGQYGINLMKFCTEFNEVTKKIEKQTLLPVKLFLYKDNSYSFIIKNPTTFNLLTKLTNLPKGNSNFNLLSIDELKKKDIHYIISIKKIYEIALYQLKVGQIYSLKSNCKTLIHIGNAIGLKYIK